MRALVVQAAVGLPLVVSTPFALGQQQQQVRPPIANYWMSVETVGGMGAMGAGGSPADIARMMMGGGGARASATRNLVLQLGSSQAAAGEPRGDHAIPPGMNMGTSLPLLTPRAQPARGEPPERELPEGVERPRGRMVIYWGCGETVRAGQPVVIDFAKLAAGQAPPNFVSRRIATQTPPSPGRARTYGDWPNDERRIAVPEGASLRGDHQVKSNYSPEIRFAIGERHDFMPAVAIQPSTLPSGAARFQWQALPSAQGYFAMAMGATGQDEIVFWSSSELQEMGGSLFDYLPNAEVARLVRERVVMSRETTECTVPADAVKAMGMPMLRFVAYGEELNFVHPPRPTDPRQPWLQEWAVKVRNKSTVMMPLSESMAAMGGGRRARDTAGSGVASDPPAAPTAAGDGSQPSSAPNPAGAVQDGVREGVRILRGIFGR